MTREKRKNTGSVILLSVLNIILICAVFCVVNRVIALFICFIQCTEVNKLL